MEMKKKMISGIGWQIATTGTRTIMNLIFIMVMARIVTKESFGVFAIVNVFISFVSMYSEVGIGSALIQREKCNSYHLSFSLYFAICVGLVAYIIIYLLSPVVSSFYDNQFSANILRIVGLNIFISSFGIVSKSLISRNLDFKKLFYIDFLSYLSGNLIVGITLGLLGYDLLALVIGIVATNIISVIISIILYPYSIKIKFAKKEAKEILYFGSGMTLSKIFNYIGNEIDKLLIGKLLDMNSLGLYERGTKIITLPGFYIGSILDRVLFPSISRIQNDNNTIRSFFLRTSGFMSIIMLYIGIVFFFYSRELIIILLGNNWLDLVIIFKIFSFIIPLRLINRICDSIIRAKGAVYKSSLIKFIFALLVVLSIFIGARWGLIGISILISGSVFINFILLNNLSLNLIGGKWVNFIKVFIPALRFAGVIIIKNIIVLYIIKTISGIIMLNLIFGLLTDGVMIFLLFRYYPKFFGKENLIFIVDIIENFPINNKLKNKILSFISI